MRRLVMILVCVPAAVAAIFFVFTACDLLGPPAVPFCDDITEESLSQALAELDGEATEVRLGASDCAVLHRTFSDGLLVREELSIRGHTASEWTYEEDKVLGLQDTALDGFFDRRVEVITGPKPHDQRAVIDLYASSKLGHTGRMQYDRQGSVFKVLWQSREDEKDSWQTDGRFDLEIPDYEEDPTKASFPCIFSEEDREKLETRLLQAVTRGLQCASEIGRPGLAVSMLGQLAGRRVRFACRTGSSADAQLGVLSMLKLRPAIVIYVNRPTFFELDEETQRNIIWHELLHAHFGGHNKSRENDGRFIEFDPVYACADVCFRRSDLQATQCACAVCLETKVDDARCAGFAACEPAYCACEESSWSSCGECIRESICWPGHSTCPTYCRCLD